MASSRDSISHQIDDGQQRVDVRAGWRGAWSVEVRKSLGRGVVVVGSVLRRRLRKERVECGDYYGRERWCVCMCVCVVEEEATLSLQATTRRARM
jgi:hypothetical protein